LTNRDDAIRSNSALHWPAGGLSSAERPADAEAGGAVDVVKILTFSFLLIVITQKLAVPLGGDVRNQVALALVVEYAVLGYLMFKGRAVVHPHRLFLYLLMAALLVLFNSTRSLSDYSLPGLMLFLVIFAMYVFVIPVDTQTYRRLMGNFVWIGLFAAGLVWMDWATQIVHLGMPNLEKVVPVEFLYREYNYLKRMWWGPLQMAPNGLFFLESSHLSQFLAMALIVEIVLFQRLSRMAILGVSMLASFGGTGLLMLTVCAPFLLMRLQPRIVIVLVMLAPLGLVLALQLGVIENISRRSDELGTRNASATVRFQKPIEVVSEAAAGPLDTFLMGQGPGTMPKGMVNQSAVTFAWAPYAKSIVEQGFIVFAVWMVLFCYCVFSPGIPFVIALAGFVQFQFLNGSLGVPLNSIYCLFLSGLYMITDRNSAEAPR